VVFDNIMFNDIIIISTAHNAYPIIHAACSIGTFNMITCYIAIGAVIAGSSSCTIRSREQYTTVTCRCGGRHGAKVESTIGKTVISAAACYQGAPGYGSRQGFEIDAVNSKVFCTI